MRYCLVTDGDCHWYIIPSDRLNDWMKWESSDEIVPGYATPIGGAPNLVTFTDPKIEK
jgi:hypothetical protein